MFKVKELVNKSSALPGENVNRIEGVGFEKYTFKAPTSLDDTGRESSDEGIDPAVAVGVLASLADGALATSAEVHETVREAGKKIGYRFYETQSCTCVSPNG